MSGSGRELCDKELNRLLEEYEAWRKTACVGASAIRRGSGKMRPTDGPFSEAREMAAPESEFGDTASAGRACTQPAEPGEPVSSSPAGGEEVNRKKAAETEEDP